MTGTRRRSLVVLGLVVAALSAGAPAAADVALTIDAVDVTGHPEVRLEVSVPGQVPAGDLAGAFEVTEDGRRRDVTARHLASSDVEIVLLIDTSGSMQGEPITAARRAASAFLGQLPAGTKVGVVGFGSQAQVLAPLSTDHAAAAAAVAGLAAQGETALYDGVATALAGLATRDDADVQRSVVVLSDGGDTASQRSLADTATLVGDAPVRLHAIELRTSETDPVALAELVGAGDGRVVPVDDAAGLDAVFTALASELVNRVELVYRSGSTGAVDLQVIFATDGARAEARRQVVLPEPPPPAIAGPAERAGELVTVASLWSDRRVVAAAAAGVFLGTLGLGYLLIAVREPRRRLATEGLPASRSIGMSGLAGRATQVAERELERRGRRAALDTALERAGLDLRPGEYLVLAASGATAAFGLGVLLANLLVGLVVAGVAVWAARAVLSFLASHRQARFADQFGDVLQLLAGSLRAGYGLLQAVDAVAREADRPTADEFGRLVVEARLGRDVAVSLRAMADRVQSEDFGWVIQAIEIHREVGGDLAEVLDTVAGTIRERNQIRRQIKALSAEGRFSAYVLLALPFVVAAMIALTNPGYLPELTTSAPGLAMLFVAATLMVVGALWLRKLTRLVF